jgi:hypothetical protein
MHQKNSFWKKENQKMTLLFYLAIQPIRCAQQRPSRDSS